MRNLSLFQVACVLLCVGIVSSFSVRSATIPQNIFRTTALRSATETASVEEQQVKTTESSQQQRRILGSQELLMLPRQYAPNPEVQFPQMNHVSCGVLSATPNESTLKRAIDEAISSHPLLRCRVEGDGEPEERIDLFQMVRKGEPNPCTFVADHDISSNDVLQVVHVDGNSRDALDASWKQAFNHNLDDGSWCNVQTGPLWKVELHRLTGSSDNQPCALVFSFNHAISDQSSANMLLDQIVANMASIEAQSNNIVKKAVKHDIPIAVEDSVLGSGKRFSDIQAGGVTPGTIRYVADKAAEGFKNPVILPDQDKDGSGLLGALTIISGKAAGGEDETSQERKSTLQFRRLSKDNTAALVQKCRERGVSVTNALSAAITMAATDYIDSGVEKEGQLRNYKVLQSLDMRRFGDQLDKCDTVACMAGSMDLLLGPLPDKSGQALIGDPTAENLYEFWKLALEGKEQTAAFIETDGPRHAVRVFDFAMTIADMNNLIHLTAQSKDSQGRAYSAGITNVGVYERQKAVRREGDSDRDLLQINHVRYNVEDVFFATSHARTGCLYQVSCMTVDGELQCTLHPASPIVSEETNARFADSFMDILETVIGIDHSPSAEAGPGNLLSALPENALATVTAVLGSIAVATHAGAYAQFFQSVMEMKQNVQDPAQFWAALNFWIFFAVGHPILQPILWISDVLHGSPGPKIADLVPYTFLAGNVIAIAAFTFSKEIQKAVNIAALAAFLTYVGAGLDGQAGLGDYNLALDDSYKGQIVKGCPAYDDVRQSSMDNFDLDKYQGKWYEHKFHDWTQFKEVYDTSLSIKLTSDGKGWIDDFAVKGPAPDAAPLSWDKSPVANGAHYFLFGRVDSRDPPGVLRESGFGVEFPNYIVDVQKDPISGEYKEAIQFQCLERGGVRVFEGINFMSRSPTMTDAEMAAMHARAEKAGMYPYGASPEQMHTVARRPEGAPDLDNAWQAMWRAIGFDKMLEILTESIEDGGR